MKAIKNRWKRWRVVRSTGVGADRRVGSILPHPVVALALSLRCGQRHPRPSVATQSRSVGLLVGMGSSRPLTRSTDGAVQTGMKESRGNEDASATRRRENGGEERDVGAKGERGNEDGL